MTAAVALFLLAGMTVPARAQGVEGDPRPKQGVAGDPRPMVEAVVKLREKLDVRYYPGQDRHLADIFTPESDKPAPVVIFAHGGGWVIGDKNLFGLYRGVARWIARQGYVVVTINYRLSPAVQHPEHCKDMARAYAWVRKNIKEYGGDPDRIVLSGHSAGGHLAALVGTDPEFLNDPELKLTDADRAALKGILSISGVYRILDEKEFVKVTAGLIASVTGMVNLPQKAQTAMGIAGLFRPKSQDINPLQLAFGKEKATYEAASPINYVRKDLPPMLLLYASFEIPPLNEQAVEFAEKLKNAGVDVTVQKMASTDHNTILLFVNWPDNPTAKMIVPFLRKVTGEGKE
jgi:acetyl esterase/lipase